MLDESFLFVMIDADLALGQPFTGRAQTFCTAPCHAVKQPGGKITPDRREKRVSVAEVLIYRRMSTRLMDV